MAGNSYHQNLSFRVHFNVKKYLNLSEQINIEAQPPKIMRNQIQHQNKSKPIVEHQSRSGKKGRKLSGIFQSRVNSMGNLSLAINFSHCCSKDWVKAQKAISFYLFNLFPFFWHALIPLIQQFFLRFFWVCKRKTAFQMIYLW